MAELKPVTPAEAFADGAARAAAASQAQALAVAISVHGVAPGGQTHVVPLPGNHEIDWHPRRKVWTGASAGVIATAVTAIVVWFMREKGVNIPIDVTGSIGILITGMFSVVSMFTTAYWVKEPPTVPP